MAELLYMTTKVWAIHRRQPLRVVVDEGIVTTEMGIVSWAVNVLSLNKKANHCPPFFHGVDRRSCHVERSSTLKRIRGKTSDTLYRSFADNPSFSARY
ncbi:hypothetical protein TNCV_3907151 [Trichonephila clavipes]|nr:hypothetical protein TNCV_3907151 [Trichonephila clavipes]